MRLLCQFSADELGEAHLGFCRFKSKSAMDSRWDPYHELPTVGFCCQRFWNTFSSCMHIGHDFGDQFAYPFECRLWSFGKPTETREFQAESDMFLVFFRPGHSIRIAIIF